MDIRQSKTHLNEIFTKTNRMSLTEQQRTAVDEVVTACCAVTDGKPANHFVLEAVAGSGKSSTLATMVQEIAERVPYASILLLQFNQEACAQMKRRLQNHQHRCTVHVHTIHSFGMKLLGQPKVDPEKMYKVWQRLTQQGEKDSDTLRTEWSRIQRLVNQVRHAGARPATMVRPLTLDNAILEECLRDQNTVDEEDAVYHCIMYGRKTSLYYDVVLVDEAQDLNDANHAFLRNCIVTKGSGTVLCAVGDPAQAIYQFRGANPDSLGKMKSMFQAQSLRLTCCFRCPRRVVFVASHLYPSICAAPSAPLGLVHLRFPDAKGTHPWSVLEDALSPLPRDESVLFMARNNRCILELVSFLYLHPTSPICMQRRIRWVAPGILSQLQTMLERPDVTLEAVKQNSEHPPVDGAVLHILATAAELDGRELSLVDSPFLSYVRDVLREDRTDGLVTLATIHSSKGAEHDHVFLYQYNLIGRSGFPDDGQERNLLYIAITRARRTLTRVYFKRGHHWFNEISAKMRNVGSPKYALTLTFLMHHRTQHVPSVFLPSDIIHGSRALTD